VIARVWRGWTKPEKADEYEEFVTESVFREAAIEVDGLTDWEVLRRDAGDEVEFVTIARFEDWAAVEAFAGEDYEMAHVPDRAQDLLARYEDEVTHYEVRG
jgi:antibiotic biosynthesis monooxygenase (ABM) superfamily enzyme